MERIAEVERVAAHDRGELRKAIEEMHMALDVETLFSMQYSGRRGSDGPLQDDYILDPSAMLTLCTDCHPSPVLNPSPGSPLLPAAVLPLRVQNRLRPQ